jgi:hypothetical protein
LGVFETLIGGLDALPTLTLLALEDAAYASVAGTLDARAVETKHSESNNHETVAGSDYGQLCFSQQQFLLDMRSVDNCGQPQRERCNHSIPDPGRNNAGQSVRRGRRPHCDFTPKAIKLYGAVS